MVRCFLVILLVVLCVPAGLGQRPQAEKRIDQSGLSSPAKLLKLQHEELKKLSARLTELATEVEQELDKGGEHILPLNTLKKLEDIEKLARKIRTRIKQ